MTTHFCQKRGDWENPRQDPRLKQRPFYLFLVKRQIECYCLDSLVKDFLGLLEEELTFPALIIICAPSYCVHFEIFLCFCLPFLLKPMDSTHYHTTSCRKKCRRPSWEVEESHQGHHFSIFCVPVSTRDDEQRPQVGEERATNWFWTWSQTLLLGVRS